jgi:fatty acyl-CoA reductase
MSDKINGMVHVFDFFMRGDWRYENQKIYSLIKLMSADEKQEFHCDCKGFVWAPYLEDYLKGMVIYVLKEDKIAPEYKMK